MQMMVIIPWINVTMICYNHHHIISGIKILYHEHDEVPYANTKLLAG